LVPLEITSECLLLLFVVYTVYTNCIALNPTIVTCNYSQHFCDL